MKATGGGPPSKRRRVEQHVRVEQHARPDEPATHRTVDARRILADDVGKARRKGDWEEPGDETVAESDLEPAAREAKPRDATELSPIPPPFTHGAEPPVEVGFGMDEPTEAIIGAYIPGMSDQAP